MESTEVENLVFRIWHRRDSGDCWKYLKQARYSSELYYAERAGEAQQFTLEDPGEIVKAYEIIIKGIKPGERVELVRVRTIIQTEQVSIKEGPILEERRRVALDKLTTSDIEALDIGKLASYNKLKFHKTDN